MTPRLRRLLAVAAFAIAVLALLELTGLRRHFSLQYLHDQFTTHLVQGTLVFVALFVLGNLAHVPGVVFLSAAVLALGPWTGSLLTFLASITSCGITFGAIRLLGADALRAIPGRHAARLFGQLDAHPIRSVALLRLVMGTLPALNYTLALSGVRFRHYLLGTLIGLPLPILGYALFVGTAAALLRLPVH
ncbi:MAG: DedA family protein [Betaproteobacteria bacterium HGW-Betaproteobacteria-3]|nr:MAG: DedA family protein [Betaproteobacteria bacterium HGW-Betaproteobacteria-3]